MGLSTSYIMKGTSPVIEVATGLLASLWTAFWLALVECVALAVVFEISYFVEIVLLKGNTGVEGGSFPTMLLHEALAIFGWRITYGFVLVTAAALWVCFIMRCRLHCLEIGLLNAATLLLAAALWDRELHLLEHLVHFSRPLYGNFMQLLLAACVFSPCLLLRLRLWGSVLACIRGDRAP